MHRIGKINGRGSFRQVLDEALGRENEYLILEKMTGITTGLSGYLDRAKKIILLKFKISP